MAKSKREEIRVAELNEPLSHYTDAVWWGDLLFISGIAPLNRAGSLVGGSEAAAQCRQILENMRLILNAADADFSDVLRITVYLTDVGTGRKLTRFARSSLATLGPRARLSKCPRWRSPG
jgi:enamine deaminase RidA (YjgF/YER057c/UK114 family)